MSSKDNRAYYLKQGRCPRCGGKNPIIKGRVLCFECQKKHDDQQKNSRHLWQEQGKCTRCGKERDDWHKMCAECRQYINDLRRSNAWKAKQRRDQLRAKGFCTRCGKTWAEPGRNWCKKCQIQHSAYTKGEEYRAKVNAHRQERIAAGLCIDCGKPSFGKLRCPECIEARRDSTRKYQIIRRIKREAEEARVNAGSRR